MALRLTSALACLLALSMLVGCPSNNDENNENNNNANNGMDMAKDMPDMSTEMTDGTLPTKWESGYQMIFTDMVFDKDSPGAGLLGRVIRKSFSMDEEYPTIILIDIKDLPDTNGEVKAQIKGGAGALTDTEGTFEWDKDTPDTYYEGSVNKDTGAIKGVFTKFSFIATIPTEGDPLRVTLPINDLTFEGNVTAAAGGGLQIEDGTLKGYITKEEGDNVMISIPPSTDIVTLTSILKEENFNYDSDGDNTNDSWQLITTFDAKPTTIK